MAPIASLLNSTITPQLQSIEVSSSLQIPSFHIIGLPSREISEARERARSAILSSGFEFPRRRIVINLSPASVRKQGTGLDLPITLALLQHASGTLERSTQVAWGELSLNGEVRPAGQPTRILHAAWSAGARAVIVAKSDADALSGAWRLFHSQSRFQTPGPELYAVATLSEAWEALTHGSHRLEPTHFSPATTLATAPPERLLALPKSIERVVLASASQRLHIMLLGPKGVGKSHALEWLTALQPEPTDGMLLQRRLISELKGSREPLSVRRVSPQVRPSALLGYGGEGYVRPGELSLAHGGLLLADEFPEWSRDSREALRQPLEEGKVWLSTARGSLMLPSQFGFAATGNLCPCGGWPREIPLPSTVQGITLPLQCTCPLGERRTYLNRISGPLLDRMDIVFRMGISRPNGAVRVEPLRAKALAARSSAIKCWGAPLGELEPTALEAILDENPSWKPLLREEQMSSLRTRHRVLRVALSLAILDGEPAPSARHFGEAAWLKPETLIKLDV